MEKQRNTEKSKILNYGWLGGKKSVWSVLRIPTLKILRSDDSPLSYSPMLPGLVPAIKKSLS